MRLPKWKVYGEVMKQKTSKLRKLEQQRHSILTDNLGKCYICGQPASEIHEIYAGSNRKQSMKYGFCVPLCRLCHFTTQTNAERMTELKEMCQAEFEKTHSRAEFMAIIGKNYNGAYEQMKEKEQKK